MADTWTAKLDAYLDGELGTADMQALDAHVRQCPECAADVLNRVQLRRATRSAAQRYRPSAEFRQRVQGAIRPRRSFWLAWPGVASAFAIALVAVVAVVWVGRTRLQGEQTFSEVADLHVATLASGSPVEVVSTDRHTVKPWFQGKIPFTFNLPELQNSEFSLLGGRMTYLEHEPGAHLIYQVRKHELSVFIFQEPPFGHRLSLNSGLQKEQSFNLQTWNQNDLRYFVIGDAGAEDIEKLSELLKNAARQ